MSKFKDLKGIIHSPQGALKVTGLSNFLSLIEPQEVHKDNENVVVRTEGQKYGQIDDNAWYEWADAHVDVLVDMIPMGFNINNRLELMRFYLLDKSRMYDIPNKDLNKEIYDATNAHSYEYGVPTHLVRIASRLWMVANPDDFVIFLNRAANKIGLFVKDDKRTRIYSVHRGEPKTFKMLGMN